MLLFLEFTVLSLISKNLFLTNSTWRYYDTAEQAHGFFLKPSFLTGFEFPVFPPLSPTHPALLFPPSQKQPNALSFLELLR
jgi:hypothetical protein